MLMGQRRANVHGAASPDAGLGRRGVAQLGQPSVQNRSIRRRSKTRRYSTARTSVGGVANHLGIAPRRHFEPSLAVGRPLERYGSWCRWRCATRRSPPRSRSARSRIGSDPAASASIAHGPPSRAGRDRRPRCSQCRVCRTRRSQAERSTRTKWIIYFGHDRGVFGRLMLCIVRPASASTASPPL